MCRRTATVMIDGVEPGFVLALAVPALAAGIWVAAGIVADGLPEAVGPAELSRRTRRLLAFVVAALIVTAGAAGTAATVTGGLTAVQIAPAAAGAAVAVLALRRLLALRRGAAAFADAPDSPLPPGLRAAAAHPMIALPIQACGLVALPAAVATTGLVPVAGAGAIGPAVTAAVPLVVAIGVRHALRHNRLAERAVTMPARAVRAAGYLRG
jgi:hypothetical protein